MKNITVSMKEDAADWARLEAARRNTSVSRLLGEMVAEKMRHNDSYERAMNEWLNRIPRWKTDGTAYPTRDASNDRSDRGDFSLR